MKCIRIKSFSNSLDNLRVENISELPTLQGEAKVRINAASINPSDVKNAQGKMGGTTLPRIPGRDFAGVVIEGPDNMIGREVWGTGGEVGFTHDGSHAEFITIPVEAISSKPHNLTFEEAACIGVNFVTAYQGLIRCAKLKRSETLLVTGPLGGVGSAVLQLGQTLGAKLVAADRRPFLAESYERLGLLGYVDTSQHKLGEAVHEITKGRGVDVAFDCVGGEIFEPVISTLRQLGRHVAITSVGTRRVAFDLLDFYHHRLTLFGVDSRALTAADCAKLLSQMSTMFEAGHLRPPVISKRGTLEAAYDLYSFVAGGGGGKAVFVVSSVNNKTRDTGDNG